MQMLMNMEQIFLWLMVYSFFGWVYETILCSAAQRKLVNRGFLLGPICPIYGCGAVLIILVLGRGTENVLGLFLSGAMLTCTLEYATSYLMEKLFHARWWDYSKRRYNLNGRVCLEGALVFGTFSVLLVRWIHPAVSAWLTNHLSAAATHLVCAGLLLIITLDCVWTVRHLLSLNGRLQKIQAAFEGYRAQLAHRHEQSLEQLSSLRSKVRELPAGHLADLKAGLQERFEDSRFYSEHIRSLLDTRRFQDKRLLNAFPNLTSTKYKEALEQLRTRLENRKKKS